MATTIGIEVGPLTRTRVFTNDTKATAALLAFYNAYDLGPDDATPAQKLDAIIDWLVGQVVAVSTQQYIEAQRDTIQADAEALYGFNTNGN